MDFDAQSRTDLSVKAEDDLVDTRMAEDRPTYRSWKKKYRKMRIKFDQNMKKGEELYKREQKALATARRLAIEKDRLLDLLLDVNNSAQIPPEKRFDLSLDPPSDDDALFLDIDRPSTPPPGDRPTKSYKKLLKETPHSSYATASEQFPSLLADLQAGRDSPADPSQGTSHPPSFLTADEIDNYLHEIDLRLAHQESARGAAPAPMLPTLAPIAQANGHNNSFTSGAMDAPTKEVASSASLSHSRDFALRNPTSVYNWLRKHAPKTFLQDGEAHPEKDKGGDHDDHHTGSGRGKGGAKGERGSGRGGSAVGSARSKRNSKAAAAAAAAAAHADEYDDDLGSYHVSTPTTGAKGKRKRIVDDDPGYRPKGGSSRPTKKKRKSEAGGGGDSTPTASASAKRSRKSGGAHGDGKGGDD